jgi:hypothetical protein
VSSAKTRVLAELTIRFGGRLFDRAAGAIGAGSVIKKIGATNTKFSTGNFCIMYYML